jgi:hypothetical protein
MEKPKKIEEMNRNIEVKKTAAVAGRLSTHVEKITGYLATIGENWNKLGAELKAVKEEGDFGGTFEEWVKETFDRTRSWAYQFIESFEARAALPDNVKHEIQNPRQALALASAPIEKRTKIIEAVRDSGKPVTAKAIKQEIAKQEAVDADVDELDELGKKIPKEILSEWNRAKDEAKENRGLVNQVARWFTAGLGDGGKRDPIFRAVTMSNAKLFSDIKRQIGMVDPYAVCPTCKGSTKVDGKKCPHCMGTGFLSKFEFDNAGKDSKKTAKKK